MGLGLQRGMAIPYHLHTCTPIRTTMHTLPTDDLPGTNEVHPHPAPQLVPRQAQRQQQPRLQWTRTLAHTCNSLLAKGARGGVGGTVVSAHGLGLEVGAGFRLWVGPPAFPERAEVLGLAA